MTKEEQETQDALLALGKQPLALSWVLSYMQGYLETGKITRERFNQCLKNLTKK